MKVIGLTGSSGSGKSTVSALLREHGFYIIDCDRIAREVLRPDTDCLRRIFGIFGPAVRNGDGSLNRRALAGIVFADPEKLRQLDEIMYPQITADILDILKECRKRGEAFAVLDAPTLFESGADALCDCVVSVLSDDALRIKRIMERDRLTPEEAQKRLSSQQPNAFYEGKSDFVMKNSGSLETLRSEAATLVQKLMK